MSPGRTIHKSIETPADVVGNGTVTFRPAAAAPTKNKNSNKFLTRSPQYSPPPSSDDLTKIRSRTSPPMKSPNKSPDKSKLILIKAAAGKLMTLADSISDDALFFSPPTLEPVLLNPASAALHKFIDTGVNKVSPSLDSIRTYTKTLLNVTPHYYPSILKIAAEHVTSLPDRANEFNGCNFRTMTLCCEAAVTQIDLQFQEYLASVKSLPVPAPEISVSISPEQEIIRAILEKAYGSSPLRLVADEVFGVFGVFGMNSALSLSLAGGEEGGKKRLDGKSESCVLT